MSESKKKTLLFSILIISLAILILNIYKNDINDWITRQKSPNFNWPIDTIEAREQADVIGEFQRRGYKLECYGNLYPEQKLTPYDDYQCYFFIKTAYDNIPAKIVTFSFVKGKLNSLRIEFPYSSFDAVQSYLSRRLSDHPRLDLLPMARKSADIYGKPIMVWGVNNGTVMTSGEPTENQPLVLLWSAL